MIKLTREIDGREIEIQLTEAETRYIHEEYLYKQREDEVLSLLSDIALNEEESDEMTDYDAVCAMVEMIKNPGMIKKVTDRYMAERDMYPDGEQEMNCIVRAVNEEGKCNE